MTLRLESRGKRVAFYARFSSDLQKDRSIEDQYADLEKAAKRIGFNLPDRRHYFPDRGVTATTLFERPGLTRDLLGAAARGEFDAVLVEATDRLSRDRADLFWLAKRFKFYNITLYTPMGEVSDMQLTFDGHTNEDFSKKLAMRVKRGHDGITREGKLLGVCYGYDTVPGQPGVRVRNEVQATVIRRIFTEYVSGMTPRQIAAGLMRDGIPSPSGRASWNHQVIVGGNSTGRGIIHGEIYRGKVVRNRFTTVKNPDTGKRLPRRGDPADLIVVDAPDMRIVSDELWNAAHAVRQQRAVEAHPAGYKRRQTLPRKPYLLAGMMKCGTCNGKMTFVTSARGGQIGCSNARYHQTCDHTKAYKLEWITEEVVSKMEKELTDPEFLTRRMRARALELAKDAKEKNREREPVQRQLDRLNVVIPRLVDAWSNAMADGLPADEIKAKMQAAEAERVTLKERLRLLGDGSNVTPLPSAVTAQAKHIKTLIDLLRRNPEDPACRMALGNLIDCVLVHPTPKRAPYDLSLYVRVSAIGNLNLSPEARSHEQMVADEGVANYATVANIEVRLPQPFQRASGEIMLLGRWRAAA